jgi:hypothetical protein
MIHRWIGPLRTDERKQKWRRTSAVKSSKISLIGIRCVDFRFRRLRIEGRSLSDVIRPFDEGAPATTALYCDRKSDEWIFTSEPGRRWRPIRLPVSWPLRPIGSG